MSEVKHLTRRVSRDAVDLSVLALALALAFVLRFEGDIPGNMLKRLALTAPYIVTLQYLVLLALGIPRFSWRFVGLREVTRIAIGATIASSVLVAGRLLFAALEDYVAWAYYLAIPSGVIALDWMLVLLGISGVRALRRILGERSELGSHPATKRRIPTMLVGAGEAGLIVVRNISSRPNLGMEAVGFLDDDPAKQGSVVHGVPVLGTTADLAALCEAHNAEQVLITIAHASGPDIRRIAQLCESIGITPKIIPAIQEIVAGEISINRIRDVAIDDLLRRPTVKLDEATISDQLRGRVVLVTGAGGSIGSELCRQVARFMPRRLVLVEQAENALFNIDREMRETTEIDVVACVANVCDRPRMDEIFESQKPELVFHAAAHKHVPLMEANPAEAIKNNVFGTRTLADAASAHGVAAFVMISTDKAVRPTSIMGATKRAAEIYVQTLASHSRTRFVSVRFGNVLGSQGSVVPIFREQIARGGPVTVTHPDMRRYFMTIPEASQLVLQAGTMGRHNEIFILDMGEPVLIVDLARDLIRLSGLKPGDDIKIQFTGIRPGEKLYEELSTIGELDRTVHPDILVERSEPPTPEAVEQAFSELAEALREKDESKLRAALVRLIPEAVGFGTTNRSDGPTALELISPG